MPIPSQPPRLENVIGTQADVFTIPEETPEGTSALSYQSGWPARSATALSAGGVPPQREYFNAVNKLLSQHVFFQQSGSLYQWNNQNNYLQGAHILGSDGKEYVAVQASGPDSSAGAQDPAQDTESTYWTSVGSSVAAAGGGLEIGDDGKLYVAKLKTPRAIDGVNFDGSEPVTRFVQCSTAAGTAAKAVTVDNFTLVEGATIMVLFNNTNTANNPTLNVSGTGAHPIQWRKEGVSARWLAANRLYALTYTGSAWQIQGDLTEACIQEGGGLSVDEDGKLFVDFDSMPTDKFEAMLKSIRVPIWLEANKAFYVNQATGSDTLDTGRGESADKPFKTITAALQYVANNYNLGIYNCYIMVYSGVYNEDVINLPKYNTTTGNLVISGYSEDVRDETIIKGSILLTYENIYLINHLTIDQNTRSVYGYGVSAQMGRIDLYDVCFDMTDTENGSSTCYAIRAEGGSVRVWASNDDTLDGIIIKPPVNEITGLIAAYQSGTFSFTADITIMGNATVSYTVTANSAGLIQRGISTLPYPGRMPVFNASGTITGSRYVVDSNGIIDISGGGAEFFPGSEAGSTKRGGQYL